MEKPADLFSTYYLGDYELKNRMVMAPMTRCRALPGNIPNPIAVTYYTQRASAGLIVTEGSQVSPQGVGYVRTPGIYLPDQVTGWKQVTQAVHGKGGTIFLQLWHVGRMSHPDFLNGALPIAPSALPVDAFVHTPAGKKQVPVPRALETQEIPEIIEQFKISAKNAKSAGFDGVEIHGANGYLLDQFLRDGSNKRTDQYGGDVQNRGRLPLEVTEAVVSVWGGRRVGYRISPHFSLNSMSDSNPYNTFTCLAKGLDHLKIGYIHLVEPIGGRLGATPPPSRLAPAIKKAYSGTLILNGGYDAVTGNEAVGRGYADLVSFGVPFLANPDLPGRFKMGVPLNSPDISTFYEGEEHGYTDYPALYEDIAQ